MLRPTWRSPDAQPMRWARCLGSCCSVAHPERTNRSSAGPRQLRATEAPWLVVRANQSSVYPQSLLLEINSPGNTSVEEMRVRQTRNWKVGGENTVCLPLLKTLVPLRRTRARPYLRAKTTPYVELRERRPFLFCFYIVRRNDVLHVVPFHLRMMQHYSYAFCLRCSSRFSIAFLRNNKSISSNSRRQR